MGEYCLCSLLYKHNSIVDSTPIELIGWLEPRFLRLLVSHEDTDLDNLKLEGMRGIRWFNLETVGLWQDQMWPPWRERSLYERIKCILESRPGFDSADQLKLWVYEPPEDIWTECGELSDELLAYMLETVARTVLGVVSLMFDTRHNGRTMDEQYIRLEKEFASWSELIGYGLKDKILDSGFWKVHSNTPIQTFFWDYMSKHMESTRQAEDSLFYITDFLYKMGVDLAPLGRVEQDQLRLGVSRKIRVYSYRVHKTIEMIGFGYGPEPEDWKIWWSNPLDEWGRTSWASVEDADEGDEVDQEEKDMPGAWPDSEDDSSDWE